MLTNEKIKKRPDLYLEIRVVHRGLDKGYETFPSKGKISYPFCIFNTTESSLMLLLRDFFEFQFIITCPIGYLY